MTRNLSRRAVGLIVCGGLTVVLLVLTVLVPLPYTLVVPGRTADTLGAVKGEPVIEIEGHRVRETDGNLRLVTIGATVPDASIKAADVVDAWFDQEKQVLPRAAVYPEGKTDEQLDKLTARQMATSQQAAVDAALSHLDLDPDTVEVTLNLADVGGPSAGLMFTLGIIDKLDGNGSGGELTGGRDIAGTGTITRDGRVGAVGGVPMKTLAADRAGAEVFLVPQAECGDARANLPDGLRLIPVTTLDDALDSLAALDTGEGRVPTCG